MARYIDIKYLGQCETCRHHRSGKCDTWCECGECYRPDVSKIPIADVVKVVKCSECVNGKKAVINDKGFKICPVSGMEITDNDYCSYGERKSENE